MGACNICKETASRSDAGCLLCAECKNMFHGSCLNLSDEDVAKNKLSIVWICPKCISKTRNLARKNSVTDSTDFVTHLKELRTEITSRNNIMDNIMSKLDTKLDSVLSEIGAIRMENSNLGTRVGKLEEAMKDFHVATVATDPKEIEIRSPITLKEATKYEMALEIVRSALGATIGMGDIDDCFIVNLRTPNVSLATNAVSRTGSHNVKQVLIMRLTTGRVRDEIIKLWRQKRGGKGISCIVGGAMMNVFFRERLPKSTKSVLDATREYAKNAGWKYVWVRRGRIYVRVKDGGVAHWVHNMDQLHMIK